MNVNNENSKTDSNSTSNTTSDNYRYTGQPYINPFVHRLDLDNPLDIIKAYVCTILLVPIRLVCIFIFLIIAWILASIGLYGLTADDLKSKPITGWRKIIQLCAAFSVRGLFAAAGFNYIVYKGVQASPKEAPILCVAPHSSYVDSIVVVTLGPPSIVAKAETSELPFFGKLINYSQPIYVMREDPNSRQNTIKKIVERANATDQWPQIVIFPEGTCTNRSALITFKPGAFYPGVPVQPVLLRYPNKLDSYTWTWEGPGVLKLLWITLTQIHNTCEIEFLPVYNPSEEEKSNPKLYAKNVRDVMARALGVPVSDFTYDDCKVMTKAKSMEVPHAADIVEIEKLINLLEIKATTVQEQYLKENSNQERGLVSLQQLSHKLNVSSEDVIIKQLFSVFDCDKTGEVSFRDFTIIAIFLSKQNDAIIEFLKEVSKLYSTNGTITEENFANMMKHSGQISKEESNLIYAQLSEKTQGNVTFDDFFKFVQSKTDYEWLFKTEGKQKLQ